MNELALKIEDLLNTEQFDINTRNNETSLSPQQKLNLEESFYIKLYLRISQGTDEIIM
ncbi:12013_t:CDS:2 [Rhizophagus irregularis]|nr:12013_t:CDS:2 [Rhizophagus irregularis]